jgi:hypothetical protein
MIIPIGVDCAMAEFCKKYNLRSFSFPFDWVVTYNGVSKCIENNFEEFIPKYNEQINRYDIYFHHDFLNHTFSDDEIKYRRRIQRLINILQTSEEQIIFCRKGHACHHHGEKYCNITNTKSDIDDAENLDLVLQNKYPKLNYKIIVILVCGICFDSAKTYESTSDKIMIYNIATPEADNIIFEKCVRNIFKV